MERRKRRPTRCNFKEEELCECENCRRDEPEESRAEYLEEELLPIRPEEEYLKPQPSLSFAVPNMYFVRDSLKRVWCKETAYQKSLKSGRRCPSRGQCYVTTLLIQEIFGGEIMIGTINGEEHYWNMINNIQIDFTSDQYGGDGYHPVILNGVIAKVNKENKRFQLLKKRWLTKLTVEDGWIYNVEKTVET